MKSHAIIIIIVIELEPSSAVSPCGPKAIQIHALYEVVEQRTDIEVLWFANKLTSRNQELCSTTQRWKKFNGDHISTEHNSLIHPIIGLAYFGFAMDST